MEYATDPSTGGMTFVSTDLVFPSLRRSTRTKSHPSWLSYFVTNHGLVSNPSNLQVHDVSDTHVNFMKNLSSIKEPHNNTIASKSPHWV